MDPTSTVQVENCFFYPDKNLCLFLWYTEFS